MLKHASGKCELELSESAGDRGLMMGDSQDAADQLRPEPVDDQGQQYCSEQIS